jgi:hypothetical protein
MLSWKRFFAPTEPPLSLSAPFKRKPGFDPTSVHTQGNAQKIDPTISQRLAGHRYSMVTGQPPSVFLSPQAEKFHNFV